MGFWGRLFGKKKASSPTEESSFNLAFVLLSEARLPSAEDIVSNFSEFCQQDESIHEDMGTGEKSSSEQALAFRLQSEEKAFVMLMPAPVPNEEAEYGAQYSLSSLGTDWSLPTHSAHLIVTYQSSDTETPIDKLSRFTSFLATVAKSSESVGIYWGNAGATHDSKFFITVAADLSNVSRVMLWSGLSMARESDGGLSLLSLGMKQLNLPNLLLIASKACENDALEMFYDMLGYLAERGEPLQEGETVGRTEHERLPIRYVKSPVDSKEKVWRIELN